MNSFIISVVTFLTFTSILLTSPSTSFADNRTMSLTKSKTFSIHTTAFKNNGKIPKQYSCDGQDISPALAWQNTPANTKSFALILSDPDAPGGTFYHWVVYNIPSSVMELAEGDSLPPGAIAGKNSWGKKQYNGPCPPHGSEHHYIFTLYALDAKLSLSADVDALTLEDAIQTHIVGKTSITGLFKH